MKSEKFGGIDYEWCPDTYWEVSDPLAAILLHVKGTNRRQIIIHHWEAGTIGELDKSFLSDTFGGYGRHMLEMYHPSFMGGEYLPAQKANQVEIVRVELQSTTRDVVSIRPVRRSKDIRYAIVDEYDTNFHQPRQTSRRPLSLAQMIDFIMESGAEWLEGGLALGYNNMNAAGIDGDRGRLRHFTTVNSLFYPQLHQHFEHVFENWIRRAAPETES